MFSSIYNHSNNTGFGDFQFFLNTFHSYFLYYKIETLFFNFLYNLSYAFIILCFSRVREFKTIASI